MIGPTKRIKIAGVIHTFGLFPGLAVLIFVGAYCYLAIKAASPEMLSGFLWAAFGYWFKGTRQGK